jgi:hypothetical protein
METSANISTDEYVCNICNKKYKNKSGIWKHNNKYHNKLITPNNSESTPTQLQITPNNSDSTPNKFICKYCNKKFTRIDNLNRHINLRCNNKHTNNLEEENLQLKDALIKQSNELKEVKLLISDLINKNCKVHPKTLHKINKQLTGDHNTINENNNINKGTINNTYNIIALGHENLTDVFSKKEKLNILKYRFNSLSQLVEYAHFNDKYPQFKNILITNTQNNLAYKYDTKKKQFVAVNKDELLEDIVDERMCDINSFYEELEEELDTKTKEILDKVKDKIENEPSYKELKKQDIKLIIYNNRKKVSKEISDNLEIEL